MKRGVAIGTTALASLIAAHQAQAEPIHLAKTITAAARQRRDRFRFHLNPH